MIPQVDWLFTREIPNTIAHFQWDSLSCAGGTRGRLTLNKEPNVGHPYASRDRYDELLPVPNGDADDAHERLHREDSHIA
jgi:hypothetical protein